MPTEVRNGEFQRKGVIFWYIEPSLNNTLRAVSWSSGIWQGLWSTFIIMIFPPLLPVALLLQAALCLASAATNYSVDDQDPRFKYSGSWERITTNLNSAGGNLDIEGGHMLAYAAGSSATITYTCAYLSKGNSIIKSSQPITFPPFLFFLSIFTWQWNRWTKWTFIYSRFSLLSSNSMALPSFHRLWDRWKHTFDDRYAGPFSTCVCSARKRNRSIKGSWTVDQYCESRTYDSCNHPTRWRLCCCWYVHVSCPSFFGKQKKIDWIWLSFEVLDSSISTTSSTISSTSQTSSSAGTTSGTPSSSSQGPSSTLERNLAISMGVVGTSLAVLLIFLLWRFCIRPKGKSGGSMDPITAQYHSVPTIPGNGTHVPLNDNSVSMRSDSATSHYGLGMQKYGSIIILTPPYSNSLFKSESLHGPPITLSYDRGTSSYSGLPSTLYSDQSATSLPRTQPIHHDPQRRISTLSIMSDRPPMYRPNSILDESAPVSSSNGNTNEKSWKSPRIPANTLFTAVAEPEVEIASTAIPGRHEENVSVWDSGYPQPLRFVPIA